MTGSNDEDSYDSSMMGGRIDFLILFLCLYFFFVALPIIIEFFLCECLRLSERKPLIEN